ncbi:MAG TPA: hypothetical protein PLP04_09540 [Bryobacteraceae bacterium]|nr:hypothetical protein [Bryobacteraceae bacterium]
MAALEVLQNVVPFVERDLGVVARGAAVAQHEIVVAMAPDAEGQRL